ncbi:MAG: hypothetical protein ABMA64_24225 [Myxococcota bacterium]
MWFLLAACKDDDARSDSGATGPDTDTDSDTHSGPLDEVGALEAAGFVVGEGAFVFSDMSGCCGPDAQCWGNNPSTPYGTPTLPLGPTQVAEAAVDVAADFGPIPFGMARTFHLRPDEAFVTLGVMPPTSRYFSYRSYLADRPGLGHSIVGSLGPSLNHQVIEAARGGGPVWGEPVAIVTSLDASIEQSVHEALITAGWDPSHIHDDRITGSVVRPGLEAEADTFFVLVRNGVFDDAEAGAAYRAEPPLRVLRVTPQVEQAWDEPWPWPVLPARGTGAGEDPELLAARDAMVDAVLATWPDRSPFPVEPYPYWLETVQCVQDELNCAGDNRDRFAAITPAFVLREDEALVMVGVNHEQTGKASYSSASVQTIESQRGIQAFESPDMPGSASWLVPGHPRLGELYAWIVARDCSAWPAPCAEVPYDCPGVPADEELKITVRAYLEPSTGAAPLPEELVLDTAIKLFAPSSSVTP